MLFRLLVAFIVVPLVELYLLLQLAQATSAATTFLVVIVTGILGSTLARREGLMVWQRFHQAIGEGRVPSREIQDGMMIVFAAALLLTPGLLTDAVGFLLLIPAGRAMMRHFVLARYLTGVNVQVHQGQSSAAETQREPQSSRPERHRPGHSRPGQGFTIDAEAVRRR